LDDDLEFAEFLEQRLELIDRAATEPLASHDNEFSRDFLEHAENDNLLMEVRTDELHGECPFVEAVGSKKRTTNGLPRPKGTPYLAVRAFFRGIAMFSLNLRARQLRHLWRTFCQPLVVFYFSAGCREGGLRRSRSSVARPVWLATDERRRGRPPGLCWW